MITCACDHVCMRSRVMWSRAHAVTCECSHYATLQHHTSFRQPESVWYIAPLISKMSPALQGKVRHCAFVCLHCFLPFSVALYFSLMPFISLLCPLSLFLLLFALLRSPRPLLISPLYSLPLPPPCQVLRTAGSVLEIGNHFWTAKNVKDKEKYLQKRYSL